jgi:hypothetical protein
MGGSATGLDLVCFTLIYFDLVGFAWVSQMQSLECKMQNSRNS